ncbi:hypothetical protein LIER_36709 [Lithospermum erythrorhizon]|uniref:Integrase zinc-binding domain-containing protein n=1 Tax=Lithospermum erythrorhizon TaxID=34254 RepID=A0AAV3PDM1_LITER
MDSKKLFSNICQDYRIRRRIDCPNSPQRSITSCRRKYKVHNRSYKFHMYHGELYRKLVDGPLLVCAFADNIPKVLFEVHNGWCGNHIEGRSLVLKNTRTGFFSPALAKDALAYVKKCDACQKLSTMSERAGAALTLVVEVMNRIVFSGLKKNLVQTGAKKETWPEEVPTVLWSLPTTLSHATGETPFDLVYGAEVVLPGGVGLPTYKQRCLE